MHARAAITVRNARVNKSCPAFNDAKTLAWIPYKTNDQIIFATAEGDRDTVRMINVNTSNSYQTTVSGNSPDCNANASWRSDTDTGRMYKITISVHSAQDQYTSSTVTYSGVIIKGASFDGNGFSDTGFISHPNNATLRSNFYTSANIGLRAYTNVQQLNKDTNTLAPKLKQVYKVWLAKNQGIVGYEEFHGKLWMKQ